ncbi:hypothetical protein HPB47_027561 [Ixodes persulcatus]|uniref:Uncharacterized protein n=1 Tax=Ixodes persulcatus TaxID=34615 RepID=A0AC60PVU6_IXOPE|nr:hypothetical protein HPB47_027561 [Ixodes persulcatus]
MRDNEGSRFFPPRIRLGEGPLGHDVRVLAFRRPRARKLGRGRRSSVQVSRRRSRHAEGLERRSTPDARWPIPDEAPGPDEDSDRERFHDPGGPTSRCRSRGGPRSGWPFVLCLAARLRTQDAAACRSARAIFLTKSARPQCLVRTLAVLRPLSRSARSEPADPQFGSIRRHAWVAHRDCGSRQGTPRGPREFKWSSPVQLVCWDGDAAKFSRELLRVPS